MPNKNISARDLAFTDFVELYETDPREAENRMVLLLINDDAAVLRHAMLSRIKFAAIAKGFPEPEYLKQDHSAALAALGEVGVLSAIRKRGFTFEQLLPFVSDPELLCQAYEAVCEVPLFEEPEEPVESAEQELPITLPRIRLSANQRRPARGTIAGHSVSVGGKADSAPVSGPANEQREPRSEADFEVDADGKLRVTLKGPVCQFPMLRVMITPMASADDQPVVDRLFDVQRTEEQVFIDVPDVGINAGDLRVEVLGGDPE
jgi:hypothetical protein